MQAGALSTAEGCVCGQLWTTPDRLPRHENAECEDTLTIAATAAVLLFAAWWRERLLHRKPRVLAEILDLADSMEGELLECRARLREIPALTANLAPGAQLSARATLAAEPQVQDALRDLLAHRLWLKDHAAAASLQELRSARDALAVTRASLARQIHRLAEVRAEFDQTRLAQSSLPVDPRR